MTKQQVIIISVVLIALFGLIGCTFTISVEPNMSLGFQSDTPAAEVKPLSTPTVTTTAPLTTLLPADFLSLETLALGRSAITTTLFYSISVNRPFSGIFTKLAESPSLPGVDASASNFVMAIAHAQSVETPQSPFTSTQPITWFVFLNRGEMPSPPTDMNTPTWLRFIHLDYNNAANPISTHAIFVSTTEFVDANGLGEGVSMLDAKLIEWAEQHPTLNLWVDFVISRHGKERRLFPFYPNDPIGHPIDPSGGNSVYCTQWYSCDTAQGAWSGFCHYVLRCN